MAGILPEENGNEGGLIGTDGIMANTTTIDAIKLYNNLAGPCTAFNSSSFTSIVRGRRKSTSNVVEIDDEVLLLKIQCTVVTKSA